MYFIFVDIKLQYGNVYAILTSLHMYLICICKYNSNVLYVLVVYFYLGDIGLYFVQCPQCFDAVGWATGRPSGL